MLRYYCDIIMVALFRNICPSFFFVLMVWAQHVSAGAKLYRLVNNPEGKPNQGRVQVLQDGFWADVCFKDWTSGSLQMLCEQLGYPGALRSDEIQCYYCDYTFCPGHQYVEAACKAPGYYGCINDFGKPNRLLPDHPLDRLGDPKSIDSEMTIKKCIDICRYIHSDITYAGLQVRTECFCGIKEREHNFRMYKSADDSECNYSCPGDEFEICGGEFKMSVYDITLRTCSTSKIPVNASRLGNTFDFGSVVSYTCISGLFLHGSPSLQCVIGPYPNETMWNATIPTCEVFDIMTDNPGIEKATAATLLTTTPVFIMGEDYLYTTGISIGASIGCAIFLIVTILISFYIFKRCKKRQDPTISYQNDSEVYVIPHQPCDHPKRNDDMQQESVYTGLDSSQQQTSEYQDPTNPDALKAEDEYLGLDTKSRQTEPEYQDLTNIDEVDREYQDINYKPLLAGDKEDNRDLGKKHSPCFPVPPQVKVLANYDGPYVNVKVLAK